MALDPTFHPPSRHAQIPGAWSVKSATQARLDGYLNVSINTPTADVAKALSGEHEVIIGFRFRWMVGDGLKQPGRAFLSLSTQVACLQKDDFSPPGLAGFLQRIGDIVVATGNGQRGQVFLKGQVGKCIDTFTTVHK